MKLDLGKRLPLVAAAVAGVVIAAFALLFLLPKMHEVSKAHSDLVAGQQQQQELQVQIQGLQAVKAQAGELTKQLEKLQAAMPKTANENQLIGLLRAAANRAQITATTVTFGTPSMSPTADFSILPVVVGIEGDFYQVEDFLYLLEHLPRATKVITLSVSSTSEYPTLQATINAEAYTSDISSGPGTPAGPQGAAPPVSTPPPTPSP